MGTSIDRDDLARAEALGYDLHGDRDLAEEGEKARTWLAGYRTADEYRTAAPAFTHPDVNEETLSSALDAFWRVIASRHPAPTGDLPPDGDWRLYSVARETYAHWLALNRPNYYKATVYLESPNADLLDRDIAARVTGWADVRMVNLEAMAPNVFKATVAELAGEPDAHEWGGKDA